MNLISSPLATSISATPPTGWPPLISITGTSGFAGFGSFSGFCS